MDFDWKSRHKHEKPFRAGDGGVLLFFSNGRRMRFPHFLLAPGRLVELLDSPPPDEFLRQQLPDGLNLLFAQPHAFAADAAVHLQRTVRDVWKTRQERLATRTTQRSEGAGT